MTRGIPLGYEGQVKQALGLYPKGTDGIAVSPIMKAIILPAKAQSPIKGIQGSPKRPSDYTGDYFVACGLPAPVAEYRFCPPRRWRMDFAWVEQRVALECQGGIFVQGRHSRGAALLKEWEKLNTASGMGWRFIFCQPSELHSETTITQIKQALAYTR